MKVGIKYCGGCNPFINRKRLVNGVMQKLPGDYSYEYFDFAGCDVVLVVNGCTIACAEVPSGKNIILVAGPTIDGWEYPEGMLADKVVEKWPTQKER
jgi:hypothetical protein